MNILVTTIGFSWQIVPELFGITNPETYPFFGESIVVKRMHSKGSVGPVSEIWVIASAESRDKGILDKILFWGRAFPVVIRMFVCETACDFSAEEQILSMRSTIFQTVLNAAHRVGNAGNLFISLAGGRKTMSADIQQAGCLFGCRSMLHVMDLDAFQTVREAFQHDDLIGNPERYGMCFLPVIIAENIPENDLLSSIVPMLRSFAFPSDVSSATMTIKGETSLLEIIQDVQKRSSTLLTNFPAYLTKGASFRGLLFLPGKDIDRLKTKHLDESCRAFVRRLPKCDLHTHLGGVLTPGQIIRVAESERDAHPEGYPTDEVALHLIEEEGVSTLIARKKEIISLRKEQATSPVRWFRPLISFLCAFAKHEELLERVIYDDCSPCSPQGVGIDAYQRFGDLQGSTLLQTEHTIREALRCYGESLKADNIQYVELRCSPHKYTRCGLSLEEVVNAIIEEMDRIGIAYRLIYIIGRNASIQDMRDTVRQIRELENRNLAFRDRFVAVDLAGNEGAAPPKDVRTVFLPLLEQCMRVTIHAGETEEVENIWQAVYYLSADRIGHGLRLPNNTELMKRFLDKRIGIELCPSSNIQVVGDFQPEYPLRTFLEEGLKVTLNTDNMGISRTTLSNEFFVAASLFPNMTLWDCLVMIRNSISVSFADAGTKGRLMNAFEENISEIIREENL